MFDIICNFIFQLREYSASHHDGYNQRYIARIKQYILDNLSNAILPHDRLRQYRPQYSVNEQGRWAHLQVSRVP